MLEFLTLRRRAVRSVWTLAEALTCRSIVAVNIDKDVHNIYSRQSQTRHYRMERENNVNTSNEEDMHNTTTHSTNECPPGTFGDNCTEECPLGFYGNFCVGKCTCDDYCDKQYGCVQTTRETGTLYSTDIQSQPQQITGKSALPYCQENTSSLPFFPTIFYLLLAVSVEAIVICILIGTTIYFARSREKSWNLYSCPLPANTIALETAQEDDYTLLTNRIQLPRCEMNGR